MGSRTPLGKKSAIVPAMKIGLLAGLFPFKHIVKLKQIKEDKTKKATAVHFNGRESQ